MWRKNVEFKRKVNRKYQQKPVKLVRIYGERNIKKPLSPQKILILQKIASKT